MKKFISLVLAIMLITGCVSVSFATQDSSAYDKETIIQKKKELEQSMGSLDDLQVYVYKGDPSTNELSEDASMETRFLADFIHSLESRWKLSENIPSNITDEQTRNIYRKFVQVELDILQKYEDITLDDPWLDLLAHAYVKALKNQSIAINEYYGKDQERYDEYWMNKGYNIRILVVFLITQYYKASISEQYSETMSNTITTGYLLSLGDPVAELIQFVGEQPVISPTKDVNTVEEKGDPFEITFVSAEASSSNYITVYLSLKNLTGQTIHTTTLNICFTDEKGNVIDTTYPQQPERIKPDKSIVFSALIRKEMKPYAVYVDKVNYYDENDKYEQVFLNHSEEYIINTSLSTGAETKKESTVEPTLEPSLEPTSEPAPGEKVYTLTITTTDLAMEAGKEKRLETKELEMPSGNRIFNKLVWSSSDTDIATVLSLGVGSARVTAKTPGVVTITAYDSKDEEVRASVEITVTAKAQDREQNSKTTPEKVPEPISTPALSPTPTSTPTPEPTEAPIVQSFVGLKVGDIIKMGYYEQDNDPGNLREPIYWQVLSVNNKKNEAVIISVYGLDGVSYGKPMDTDEYNKKGINWETCYLRNWLNGTFYEEAFTEGEKSRILETSLQTKDKAGTCKTVDKVYVLSGSEITKYFKKPADAACRVTQYAEKHLKPEQGAISEDGYGIWWLRDMVKVVKIDKNGNWMQNSGNEAGYVLYATGNKMFRQGVGAPIFCDYLASVRPVMTIQTDAAPKVTPTPKPTKKPTPTPKPTKTPKPTQKPSSSKYMSNSDLIELAKFYFGLYGGDKSSITMTDISAQGNQAVVLIVYGNFHSVGILMNRTTGEYLGMKRGN